MPLKLTRTNQTNARSINKKKVCHFDRHLTTSRERETDRFDREKVDDVSVPPRGKFEKQTFSADQSKNDIFKLRYGDAFLFNRSKNVDT